MPNATPRDSRAGFDLFRTTAGNITLDDLNAQLYEAGHGPVANRTFDHYRKLLAAGYDRYISINRFDVARAATPYESASANGRYSYFATNLGVRVVFAKSSRLFEASGRAIEVGEVGATLRFSESDVVEGLRKLKPQPGDMVTVRYLEAGRTVGGRVVEADVTSTPASVEIEYSRLISISSIAVGEPLETSRVEFVLTPDTYDNQTLEVVGRQIFYFFELVEGLRALSNEAGALQPDPVYAEPPTVASLSVASPAHVVLEVASALRDLFPVGLASGVIAAAGLFVAKRKEWYEGTGQKKQNEQVDQDARLKDLEIELKELEVAERRAEVEFKSETLRRLRAGFPGSNLTDIHAEQLIDDHALPQLRALARSGIETLTEGGDEASGSDVKDLGFD